MWGVDDVVWKEMKEMKIHKNIISNLEWKISRVKSRKNKQETDSLPSIAIKIEPKQFENDSK